MRRLVKDTICEDFNTGYTTDTDGIMSSIFLWVITNIKQFHVLYDTIISNCNRW